jgi:site-specific DNA-adenine methylase
MTGGYTAVRSPIGCIDALERVDLTNLTVRRCDYEETLSAHPTTFAYLDPPYDVPNLYLSEPFNHERLSAILHARQSDWILCYNDTPRIRALYADCEILPVSWAYGMNASRKSNEIVITPVHT